MEAGAKAAQFAPAVPTPLEAAIDRAPPMPVEPPCAVPGAGALPLPMDVMVPWTPPGIFGPWPRDEYLHDGGDRDVRVNISPSGDLQGLEMEDTVVLYDTIDGRTIIEPSNKVCLYAPRFGAVRKVANLVQNEQLDQPIGAQAPVKPHLNEERQLTTAVKQPIRPLGEIGTKHLQIERVGEAPMPAISRQPIEDLLVGLQMFENIGRVRHDEEIGLEIARVLEGIDAAILWTHDLAVQMVVDGRSASEIVGNQKAQVTFRFDAPNNPCLKVIKVASTKVASPGDIVEFTISFQNFGDTELRNVVLVDNLTTRLEYVDESAQSSVQADFFTEVNEGQSLVLRWELTEPLPVGEGGLVHFRCRVR